MGNFKSPNKFDNPPKSGAHFCPVCSETLIGGLTKWHFQCTNCLYEGSLLKPEINQCEAHQKINEIERENGLKTLRLENFKILLKHIRKYKNGKDFRLLDVGAAHGWFIDLASDSFLAEGLEPDQGLFEYAKSRGKCVRRGFFPSALNVDERFDVIVFNDVMEHIPDTNATFSACYDFLNPSGLLILNVPSNRGVFYRLSKLLARIGLMDPFDRLWQKDFPSPHLHYFNIGSLTKIGNKNRFSVLETGHLPSLSFKGLFTRIAYDQKHSLILNLTLYILVGMFIPLLRILPKDIDFLIFEKTN